MKEVTKAEFLSGVQDGSIEVLVNVIDFAAQSQTIYGKDHSLATAPKSYADREKQFEIVYVTIP